ncbi:Hypothetical protein R9X50_00525500 [Acrodontium crateriforme]|uniref:t-SNARE coiled-coil homology domain-containing protein n=1 Tax=Acrodontium crateriforme TaxID=150365 RepID=A0AAQ3M7I0_9PEZI|nr:Hypothetical protein R9X50_00525500 [Acrodontium crateriforme]
MPFGIGKKDKGGDLDSQKASLFGKSSKTSSQAPASQSANPYANPPPASDPYAQKPSNPYATQARSNDPYAQSQSSLTQPPTSSFGSLTLNSERGPSPAYGGPPNGAPNRYEKSPVPPGGYGGGAPRYQNTGGQGPAGGYGSDPYGNGQSRHGAGGYGGLGRSNSQDTVSTDAGRNALFGDAASRAKQSAPSQPPSYGQGQDSSYSNTGGYDSTETPGGYGAEKELTAEEQEEQDVQAAKDQIRFIKQQDVASTRNARRIAEQAEAIGRETLARLGAQGERIHNTERNLDSASNQNVLAREKAAELKTLNRSMFAVHVANPFLAKKRAAAADQLALEKNQDMRRTQEATNAEASRSAQRQAETERTLRGSGSTTLKQSLANRGKYQFEADSEDEAMENEIDENLEATFRGAQMLNRLGQAMGNEIDSQNKHIDRIIKKTDKVDDEIAVNRARLERIR